MIFRYPGAKTKLRGVIYNALSKPPMKEFHDVYVGGGSILCHVAEMNIRTELYANDLNPNIAAFWRFIAKPERERELFALLEQTPTVELFNELRIVAPINDTEKAYRAIFFNRTTFSGIETAGPIGGTKQESRWKIDCRYNAREIKRGIERLIQLLTGRLHVYELDAEQYLASLSERSDARYYLDPPYYAKGKDLYKYFMTHEQHERLATQLRKHDQWVLSYDDCANIRELYAWANISQIECLYSISGTGRTPKVTKELLITGH